MELTGKAFRSESTIVYVEGVETSPSGRSTSYYVIIFSKEKFGYNIVYHTMRDTAITYNFPIETDSSIVLKAKAMFELNYIACCALAKNAKVVKSSRHVVRVCAGVLLWGLYAVSIYKYYIRIQPMSDVFNYYRLAEHITKKDYNKIFRKVKKLREDLDELWTGVV